MRKERKELKIADIELNKGQLEWLPQNPRQWTKADIERTAKSIEEDPDFLEDRPLLVVAFGKKYVVFGGNLRREGCKKLGKATAPAVEYFPETGADYQTVIRRSLKDNGSFGSFDYDILANEYDDLPLEDYGLKVWDDKPEQQNMEKGLSTEGREGGEDYDAFREKFNEELPLTTDDCYTPAVVYDLVRDFVDRELTPLQDRQVVRPFFPGGDYEDMKQYPKGCIVIDNPPFSLYSKIVRFYLTNGIDFFLFGPQLSLIVAEADCCFCVFNTIITYENGAKVNTGFVTNLKPGVRIWVEHTLRDAIQKAQKADPTSPVYEYPDEVISSALLGKIANGGDLELASSECQYIHNLDGMKDIQRGLFGGGFLLSRAAAEKARAAAEKARAAAEKARAVKISLSAREVEIVNNLSK